MSEFQYYEFQAIDRALSQSDISVLRNYIVEDSPEAFNQNITFRFTAFIPHDSKLLLITREKIHELASSLSFCIHPHLLNVSSYCQCFTEHNESGLLSNRKNIRTH